MQNYVIITIASIIALSINQISFSMNNEIQDKQKLNSELLANKLNFFDTIKNKDLKNKEKLRILAELLQKDKSLVNCTNKKGTTPLLLAYKLDNAEILWFFLQNGANKSIINIPDLYGYTILINACFYNKKSSTIETLLFFGAEANIAARNGTTPLLLACINNNYENVATLLPYCEEEIVNYRTWVDEVTPLIFACNKENIEIVEMLLRHGADPNKGATNGDTPLKIAILRKNIEIINLLIKYGADADQESKEKINKLRQEDPNVIPKIIKRPEITEILETRKTQLIHEKQVINEKQVIHEIQEKKIVTEIVVSINTRENKKSFFDYISQAFFCLLPCLNTKERQLKKERENKASEYEEIFSQDSEITENSDTDIFYE